MYIDRRTIPHRFRLILLPVARHGTMTRRRPGALSARIGRVDSGFIDRQLHAHDDDDAMRCGWDLCKHKPTQCMSNKCIQMRHLNQFSRAHNTNTHRAGRSISRPEIGRLKIAGCASVKSITRTDRRLEDDAFGTRYAV